MGEAIFLRRGGVEIFSGKYVESNVVGTDGKSYRLYTITSSGTLYLEESAKYWICGGGGNGNSATAQTTNSSGSARIGGYAGGGGGGGYTQQGTLSIGTYIITVGSRAAQTKIVTENATSTTRFANGAASASKKSGGGSGSSGGGCASGSTVGTNGNQGTAGTGSGSSTYPFGISSLNAHCAGGGAGCKADFTSTHSGYYHSYPGGAGGTNGSDGASYSYVSDTDKNAAYTKSIGGTGGARGGGNGGSASSRNGRSASFYGSGGGGGAYYNAIGAGENKGSAGSGYQGVCYLLIPA